MPAQQSIGHAVEGHATTIHKIALACEITRTLHHSIYHALCYGLGAGSDVSVVHPTQCLAINTGVEIVTELNLVHVLNVTITEVVLHETIAIGSHAHGDVFFVHGLQTHSLGDGAVEQSYAVGITPAPQSLVSCLPLIIVPGTVDTHGIQLTNGIYHHHRGSAIGRCLETRGSMAEVMTIAATIMHIHTEVVLHCAARGPRAIFLLS